MFTGLIKYTNVKSTINHGRIIEEILMCKWILLYWLMLIAWNIEYFPFGFVVGVKKGYGEYKEHACFK